jgi:hypothetical protein
MSTITLCGDLDIYALTRIERAFASLADEHVVIDVRRVRTVSAAFFGALARLRQRLPDSRIEVVGASTHVRTVFHIVHADALVLVS